MLPPRREAESGRTWHLWGRLAGNARRCTPTSSLPRPAPRDGAGGCVTCAGAGALRVTVSASGRGGGGRRRRPLHAPAPRSAPRPCPGGPSAWPPRPCLLLPPDPPRRELSAVLIAAQRAHAGACSDGGAGGLARASPCPVVTVCVSFTTRASSFPGDRPQRPCGRRPRILRATQKPHDLGALRPLQAPGAESPCRGLSTYTPRTGSGHTPRARPGRLLRELLSVLGNRTDQNRPRKQGGDTNPCVTVAMTSGQRG